MSNIIREENCHARVDFDSFNKRIRVLDYEGMAEAATAKLLKAGKEQGYEKIIVFAKAYDQKNLTHKLFVPEGEISGYYNGHKAVLMARYLEPKRKETDRWDRQDHLIQTIYDQKQKSVANRSFPFSIREASVNDADSLARLYSEAFPLYPVPITDPAYIKKSMNGGTVYYACFDGKKLVSAASAEVNHKLCHAEVTDCATLSEYAGNSILTHLIHSLEKKMKEYGIFHVFSLARADSFGMNKTLFRLSYAYGGRLCNNCVIYKGLENMNIWHKQLCNIQLSR
jgi:putative beta-lysine N-acetyltransferase